MTFLEKAVEIEKSIEDGVSEHDIPSMYCPSDYRFEGEKKCNAGTYEECKKCWNREMPNTEAEKPLFPTEDFNAGYDKGLNDAWELARKVYTFDVPSREKVFENHSFVEDVLFNYTPQEALAKLKAYEEAQIEVGDIVQHTYGAYFVVTAVEENTVRTLNSEGEGCTHFMYKLKRTGKHIDIKSLLEQIGE